MEAPSIDVDEDSFRLLEEYTDRMRKYYEECLRDVEKQANDLNAKLRGLERLHDAYSYRLTGLDLFLDGFHVAPLPFSGKDDEL